MGVLVDGRGNGQPWICSYGMGGGQVMKDLGVLGRFCNPKSAGQAGAGDGTGRRPGAVEKQVVAGGTRMTGSRKCMRCGRYT